MKKAGANDEQIRKLVARGFTDNAIAKRLGVSRVAILRRRKQMGIVREERVGWPKVTVRTKAQMDALYAPHGGANAYGMDDVVEKRVLRVMEPLPQVELFSGAGCALAMM
ncbi:MAG TPA: hypothetical protein DCW68_02705 [Rhodospirillaceae bacterium]|nr:MAG: hypothetical protein A2018_05680 [Alphaproteobacteria bacterium GWF2_58_20]HAU29005.1 hypothetical protein [Rhodospirillaceae bacterium]